MKILCKAFLDPLVYATEILPSDSHSFVSNSRTKNPEKLGPKSRFIFRFFLRKITRKFSVKTGYTLLLFFSDSTPCKNFFLEFCYCQAASITIFCRHIQESIRKTSRLFSRKLLMNTFRKYIVSIYGFSR